VVHRAPGTSLRMEKIQKTRNPGRSSRGS
jgi:hypothetical protein